MRFSEKARALASVAALSFTAVAAAKAPRHRAASKSAPAASSSADAKDDAPAPSGSSAPDAPSGEVPPAASSSAPATSASPSPEPAPSGSGEPAEPAPESGEPSSAAGAAASATPPGPLRPQPAVKEAARAEPEVEAAVPPARDTLGGHVDVGVNAAMLVPFGNLVAGEPQSRTMGIGLSLGGDLGYGISRTVMLGAYVDVGLPDAEGPATDKSVTTIAAGPLIRYHLVQGMAFDPWVSGGLGFRYTKDAGTSFTGVDWCRLSIGGDWYPSANFGFGPFVAMSLGTFFGQSPGHIGTAGLNAHFLLGGRIVFDTPGR
ncbi:MAG TPA: hypothetical protein VHC69_01195 [Polyangiaceae bacterium]|nr:hypothetical protein [Polyangiaceae bacterium]